MQHIENLKNEITALEKINADNPKALQLINNIKDQVNTIITNHQETAQDLKEVDLRYSNALDKIADLEAKIEMPEVEKELLQFKII